MKLPIDRTAFFLSARMSLFGGVLAPEQVSGMTGVLDAWEMATLAAPDLRMVAYTLATAYHETDRHMQPIREYGFGRGKRYGVPAGPYSQIFYGRGLVQITWWSNYDNANAKLHRMGVLTPDQNLTKTPDLALDPAVASAILIHGMTEGWFTGRKLGDFFNVHTDWVHAREIINGMDCAAMIGGYALHFQVALEAKAAAKAA